MKAAFVSVLLFCSPLFAASEYRHMGPDIFDPKAKAETLIDEATTQAQREHKRVLLLFGANWCPWCRRLHAALTGDPRITARLREHFVLIFIDANTRNDRTRNKSVIGRYGNPLQYGLPVFVVLDAGGKQLTTRETQSLADATEEGVAKKLLSFLADW
jgi:thioredoxin-related protein